MKELICLLIVLVFFFAGLAIYLESNSYTVEEKLAANWASLAAMFCAIGLVFLTFYNFIKIFWIFV